MSSLSTAPARRRATLAAGAAVAVTVLSACTGPEPESTPSAAPTPEAGITQGDRVWFCGLVNDQYVAQFTEADAAAGRQEELRDDATGWVCEVRVPGEDGGEEQAALRLSITPVADVDTMRPEYADAEGVQEGPAHLGEAYLTPGKAVAFIPCQAPDDSEFAGQDVPYAFEVEALLEPGTGMVEELEEALNRMVRPIDEDYGCSPSLLRGGATQSPPAPGEDGETTAP